MKIKDFIDKIEEIAPLKVSYEAIANGAYDNSGFLVGDREVEFTGVVVCIDVCEEAIQMAKDNNCNLILSHHPFIYAPISNIVATDYKGRLINALIKNDLAVYSAHLSMDMTKNGIDETQSHMLGIAVENLFETTENGAYGRVGSVEKQDFSSYSQFVKSIYNFAMCLGENKNVNKVASFCGSGVDSKAIAFAKRNGADVVVSADVPHHYAVEILENGMNLIQLSHGESELKAFEKILMSKDFNCKMVVCHKDFSIK